jgi:hypothetical protein
MVYYNRIKEITAREPFVMKTKLGGRFRIVTRWAEDDKIAQDTGWFDNMLLDQGVINMRPDISGNFYTYCHVGNGTTAPATTDTTLETWLGAALADGFNGASQTVAPAASNYEYSQTAVWRFNPGEGTGTINEVGLGRDSTNTNMSIRSLVAPAVVKAANQYMDVFYEFFVWPDLTDTTGTVSIGGESFNYICRASMVAANSPALRTFTDFGLRDYGTAYIATGDITAVTSEPSGFLSYAYTWGTAKGNSGLGSSYVDATYYYGLNDGNGTIRTMKCRDQTSTIANSHGLQIRIGRVSDDTGLLKDDTMIYDWSVRYEWSRR